MKLISFTMLIVSLSLFFGLKKSPETTLMKGLLQSEKNTIEVFNSSIDSVVNITVLEKRKTSIDPSWPFLNRNFGQPEDVRSGIGSGFVWDEEGHIVTNSHVVFGGDDFLITFHKDKKQYKAILVGKDSTRDLAVLKLKERPEKIMPIKVGSSTKLLVGQKAIAIGNPMGYDHTMTVGVISALDREIPGFGGVTIRGVIQTDAAINMGNSGGPLFDSRGALIGVNTLIVSPSGGSSGLGFAIPVDYVKMVIPQIVKSGKVTRPGLGVGIAENNFGDGKGLIVTGVSTSGGAYKAGIKGVSQDQFGRRFLGDIIVKVENRPTNSYNDIYHALQKYKIGDTVTVTILRDNKLLELKVKLSELGGKD